MDSKFLRCRRRRCRAFLISLNNGGGGTVSGATHRGYLAGKGEYHVSLLLFDAVQPLLAWRIAPLGAVVAEWEVGAAVGAVAVEQLQR